jgi:hypothetical protein
MPSTKVLASSPLAKILTDDMTDELMHELSTNVCMGVRMQYSTVTHVIMYQSLATLYSYRYADASSRRDMKIHATASCTKLPPDRAMPNHRATQCLHYYCWLSTRSLAGAKLPVITMRVEVVAWPMRLSRTPGRRFLLERAFVIHRSLVSEWKLALAMLLAVLLAGCCWQGVGSTAVLFQGNGEVPGAINTHARTHTRTLWFASTLASHCSYIH